MPYNDGTGTKIVCSCELKYEEKRLFDRMTPVDDGQTGGELHKQDHQEQLLRPCGETRLLEATCQCVISTASKAGKKHCPGLKGKTLVNLPTIEDFVKKSFS